jgi:hypothetical protein
MRESSSKRAKESEPPLRSVRTSAGAREARALLHIDLEALAGPFRKTLETFRQGEAVVFLEQGLPVGVLMFLSSWLPEPGFHSGRELRDLARRTQGSA